MKGGKFVSIGISVFLVVAVAIGAIVGVSHHKSADKDDSEVLSSTTKAVASICSPTDHKQACVNSLSSVANNQSATPKDYLMAAIQATMQEVKAAMEKSGSIGKDANDPYSKMASKDCQDLLQYAIHELEASFSTVGDNNLHTMNERQAELRSWISAVLTYQSTCLDGLEGYPELHKPMQENVLNATQLTENALIIVSAITDILKSFNIPVNVSVSTSASRRLLEADSEGYPTWLSAADRKLLAAGGNVGIEPNIVVAQDGSGQFKTIGDALKKVPKKNPGRFVIYVKAGIYHEYVQVDAENVFMYGDGPRKTIVTGDHNVKIQKFTTFTSATFSVIGAGFVAKGMGFQNTAGPAGEQAVALHSQADRSAFYNCRIDGYQDTLYVHTHRQFYRNCVISGTVDFIFGDSSVIIQNCLIIARKPADGQSVTITAQGREKRAQPTGIIIQNCRIVPEQKLFPARFQIPSYLGRPWKEYSMTVFMESTLGDFIRPEGWMPWKGNFALDTCFYREYANRGPGANTAKRVNWKGFGVITNRNDALPFTAGPFIQGSTWLPATGAPHFLGFSP